MTKEEQARRLAGGGTILAPDRPPVAWWRRRRFRLLFVLVASPTASLLCREFGGAWCAISRAVKAAVAVIWGAH